MKIAILGTRGIPNHYGGFEQITEQLATGLVEKGHEVTVYNSHNHPHQASTWNGVTIQHCYDPEYLLGTAGQFFYDFNCIRHARKNDFDVWLFMGYTSSSVWNLLFPNNCVIISNMDGLEWKRTKYPPLVRRFLKYAEGLAVKHSQFHIADSPAIKEYIDNSYAVDCQFIPYGVSLPSSDQYDVLKKYNVEKDEYYLLMARMEPENNIETILDGFHSSSSDKKFLVIGKTENKFGRYLRRKFAGNQRIQFIGGLFDQQLVHALRTNALLYFHGHSVGGTNPSLLEAMASGALIAAHDNAFNKAVLGKDAFYFQTAADVRRLIETEVESQVKDRFTANNCRKIAAQYNWPAIVNSYEEFITHSYQNIKRESYSNHKRWAYK